MKISNVWIRVAQGMILGTLVAAYVHRKGVDEKTQADLVEGRLGVAIEIKDGQANTVAVRQFVWRRDDGNIVVVNSLYPNEEGVRGCDRQSLDRDMEGLHLEIERDLPTLSLNDRIDLQSRVAFLVAGRVVCNFEGFKNLKDLHAYGMRYKFMNPKTSQPVSP